MSSALSTNVATAKPDGGRAAGAAALPGRLEFSDFGHPLGLPGGCYTDEALFAQEMDLVFARSWHLVGHVSQVSNKGQVLVAMVGPEQVILTHDGARRHAFFNVCRHRGHRLVTADNGDRAADCDAGVPFETHRSDSLTCGYHAWVYGFDGTLMHARGEQVGDIRIPSVRVEELAGFLYVNLDEGAAPLAETAPGVEAEVLAAAPDARNRVLTHRRTHLIHANWKVAVENYNECYHCPNVHKAFTKSVVSPGSYRIHLDRDVIRHHAGSAAAERTNYSGPYAGDTSDYLACFLWPASSIQCYPGGELNTFRWVPIGVSETLMIREWWLHETEPTPNQAEKIRFDWATTVAEDLSVMESVQQGVASRSYQPGPLVTHPSGVAGTHSEDSVPHLHSLLRRDLNPQ